MVRKTTAVDVTESSGKQEGTFDLEKLFHDAVQGAKENLHLLGGIIFLLFGLILLREFLLGIVFLITGILLISGFFKEKK